MIIPTVKMGKLSVNNVTGFAQVRTPSEAVLGRMAQPLPRLPAVPQLWAHSLGLTCFLCDTQGKKPVH